MEIDCNSLPDGFTRAYDVCVIGAGAAGMTLVNELAQSGLSIGVVESGGFSFEIDTQNLYDFENVGIPRKPHPATRLRMYGGTTNHWDGRCGPFDATDFTEREWVPHSGWPISRDELEPFYVRAADYCDLKTYPFDAGVARGRMIPLPDLDPAVHQYHVWQFSAPTRFGPKYRHLFNQGDRIDLIYHANATELQVDPSGRTLTGVRVKTLDGKQGLVRAKRYCLCTGGIENARILLYSNSVLPQGVGNGNDLVGRFFMEHPRAKHPVVQLDGRERLSQTFNDYQWDKGHYLLGMKTTPAFQRANKTLNSAYWFLPQYQADSPLNALRRAAHREGGMMKTLENGLYALENSEDIYLHMRRKLLSPGAGEVAVAITLVTETEQAPNPDSRITLSEQRDRLGLPLSKIDWRLTELDQQNATSAIRSAAVELAKHFNVRVRMPGWLTDAEGGWQNGFVDVSHHLGTTRMSASGTSGVVDANCRSHEVDNLYIAGSSVFATSSLINPTFTVVALAIRLADHLRAEA